MPAISVKNLTKKFGDFTAVDNLNFELPKNQIVGLLGGNGAGKTTTISMLLGLIIPTAGQVTVLGTDMILHREQILSRMNFSSPYVDLPGKLTVRENLTIFGHFYNISHTKSRIAELAADLDLEDLLYKQYGKLSAGQKTRVSLAKSLINRPEILLLDEPTASLDPDTADWVRGYLSAYQKNSGATILLASHNMQEVERICDDIIMMKNGRMTDRGTKEALTGKYNLNTLEDVFLHISRREEI